MNISPTVESRPLSNYPANAFAAYSRIYPNQGTVQATVTILR
jgi:hypothetical protein